MSGLREGATVVMLGPELPGGWGLSSSSDPAALDVVDGLGRFSEYGPHYSCRSPGSKTFTGVGQEVVLLHESGAAVWAVVRQRTPSKKGSGSSRGRRGKTDTSPRFVFRNMLFRRLSECPVIASELIKSATWATRIAWVHRYGEWPAEQLRTEVDTRKVDSTNPGYCYKVAGCTAIKTVRGKLHLAAPAMDVVEDEA